MVGVFGMSAFASDNISIPNTFSSGSTISSSQMNENFSEIISEINSLKLALLSKVEKHDDIVFYQTNEKYTGNLGGRDGANSICRNDSHGDLIKKLSRGCENFIALISIDGSDNYNNLIQNFNIPSNKIVYSITGDVISLRFLDLINTI